MIMFLPIALILVCTIGYLAQSIGLCMVRGVNECKNGKPEFLLAILFSGVLAWVAMLYANYFGIHTHFKTYEVNSWFVIGGIIFGFGTAFNQGCGVSTLSKLSRGDSKMIFTITGWIIGWSILAQWSPTTTHIKLLLSKKITLGILVSISIALLIWAFNGDKKRTKLWLTMMTIGLIGGFVFLFDDKWTPSGLLQKISHALTSADKTLWPPMESYFVFLSLIAGMLTAAWRSKRFKIVKSDWKQWLLHLMAGACMGIGASLALGGNDSQLLLALPTLSPGGITAILGMLIGIWSGLYMREIYAIKSLKQ
ncbi:YeeE/YedE family protein [Colwellia sp. BRX8-3]|nr:YeeE/YedE family protein [Colwellia sp. BRX8-3]MBA6360345.1 YeeE/YedE family protein [Colwellia sp. BRX8-6]MBA6367550.1 YeeE/YedE family protein [Colwellia sp. BRX8-5]MBA6376446.1 YeeE/YedE family protein [Colwellia sp. BRX8-2]